MFFVILFVICIMLFSFYLKTFTPSETNYSVFKNMFSKLFNTVVVCVFCLYKCFVLYLLCVLRYIAGFPKTTVKAKAGKSITVLCIFVYFIFFFLFYCKFDFDFPTNKTTKGKFECLKRNQYSR